jgi:hypothetical protein
MKRTDTTQRNSVGKVVDPPELGPAPSPEKLLDVAIEYTFPASDPIAVESAFATARRREQGS